MTEQERNVLLNELRQQESQREKQIKRERFRKERWCLPVPA